MTVDQPHTPAGRKPTAAMAAKANDASDEREQREAEDAKRVGSDAERGQDPGMRQVERPWRAADGRGRARRQIAGMDGGVAEQERRQDEPR